MTAGQHDGECFGPMSGEQSSRLTLLLNDSHRARLEPHPEDFCERCGRPNVTWFAPSDVWNAAVPEGGILCPVCFIQSAEQVGIKPSAWEVRPELNGPSSVSRTPEVERVTDLAISGRRPASDASAHGAPADDMPAENELDAIAALVAGMYDHTWLCSMTEKARWLYDRGVRIRTMVAS